MPLLGKHFSDNHRILVEPIHNAPCHAGIVDAEFVATRADRRHLSAVGQADGFTPLQSPKQKACLDASCRTKWWRLDLTVEPGQGLVFRTHRMQYMSEQTYRQPNISLQADKGKPSRHMRAHMARQLAFAAELNR